MNVILRCVNRSVISKSEEITYTIPYQLASNLSTILGNVLQEGFREIGTETKIIKSTNQDV